MTSAQRNCEEAAGAPYSLLNREIKLKLSEIVINLNMKNIILKTTKKT